jgi:GNAT superfamily N-acetyltransferase
MTLWYVRATVDDRPGYLSVLTASLALRSVNILSVQVHATEAGAVDDFLVDAPDQLTEEDLLAAVVKGRGRDPWVRRAHAHGLEDIPTQLLGMAARLVRDPDELGAALVALLGDCAVSWGPEPCPTREGFAESVLLLPDPAGGTLRVHRLEPPFTPAEYARAHALVDLAGTVVRESASRWQFLLPDGAELTVREAGPADAPAVRDLLARCSTAGPAAGQVERLLGSTHGTTLVVEGESGPCVVAMATLFWEGPEAEVGLHVADAWRGRGIGTALLHRVARLAVATGREALHAHTHADNAGMVRAMRRLGRPLRQAVDGPILSLTADLRPSASARTRSGSPCPAP